MATSKKASKAAAPAKAAPQKPHPASTKGVKKGKSAAPEKVPEKRASTKLVTSTELAALLGVELTKRLDTPAIRKLRKALPGYVNMLDDVAALLEHDGSVLNLRDVQPSGLLAVQARQKELSAREGVVEAVYRSIYEQRLQADDEAMGMLLKIARRIEAISEDDPDIRVRWKSLLDFLSKFRRGPVAPVEPAKNT